MFVAEMTLLAKLLGETYRLQRKLGLPCSASSQHIYGLINGFEAEIAAEMDSFASISEDDIIKTSQVLDKYWLDPKKLEDFKGFYDIEKELQSVNIDRTKAHFIFTYFRINHQFEELLNKMDSSDSPVELRKFEPLNWET